MITLYHLNKMIDSEFVEQLKDIFEHSPWVAERVEPDRPFHSIEDLHSKMVTVVKHASMEEKNNLIQAHPHLGTRNKVSSYSEGEQKNAGLSQLSDGEYELLLNKNKVYVQQFNFPFILAVRGKNKDQILQAIEERLKNSKEQEFNQALSEIYQIALFRLNDLVVEKGMIKQ